MIPVAYRFPRALMLCGILACGVLVACGCGPGDAGESNHARSSLFMAVSPDRIEWGNAWTRAVARRDEDGRWRLEAFQYERDGQWRDSLGFSCFSWTILGVEARHDRFDAVEIVRDTETEKRVEFRMTARNGPAEARISLEIAAFLDLPYLCITQTQRYEIAPAGRYQGVTYALPGSARAAAGLPTAYAGLPPFMKALGPGEDLSGPCLGWGIAIPFLGISADGRTLHALFFGQDVVPDYIPGFASPADPRIRPKGYFAAFHASDDSLGLACQPHPVSGGGPEPAPAPGKDYVVSYHLVPMPFEQDRIETFWSGVVKCHYRIRGHEYFDPVPFPDKKVSSNEEWLSVTLEGLRDSRAFDPEYGYCRYWRSWEQRERFSSAWYTSKIVVPLYFYARFIGDSDLRGLAISLARTIVNHQYGSARDRGPRLPSQLGAFQDMWVIPRARPSAGRLEYYVSGSSFWNANPLGGVTTRLISTPLHALNCYALLHIGIDSSDEQLIKAGLLGLEFLERTFEAQLASGDARQGEAKVWEAWDTVRMRKSCTILGALFPPPQTCASGEAYAASAFLLAYQHTGRAQYRLWAERLLDRIMLVEDGNKGYFPDQPSGPTDWQPFSPGTVQTLARAGQVLGDARYGQGTRKWIYHILSSVILTDLANNPAFSHTKGLVYGATGQAGVVWPSFVETPPALIEILFGLDLVPEEEIGLLLDYACLMWPVNAYGLVEYSAKREIPDLFAPLCTAQPLAFPCETVGHKNSWRQPRSAGVSLGVLLSAHVIARSDDPDVFTFATNIYDYRARQRNVYVVNTTDVGRTSTVTVNFGAENGFRSVQETVSLPPHQWTLIRAALD